MSIVHVLAVQAQALREAKERGELPLPPPPVVPVHAGLASKCRRATALLDEERAFYWEPGGFVTAVTTERADYFEFPAIVRFAEDTWTDIDRRLAESYYETRTFADFIGAPWRYE